MLGMVVTELIGTGSLSWTEAIAKMSLNPARIFNLEGRGTLAPGSFADITIIDPDREYTVDAAFFYSKSRNSPFIGRRLKGMAERTLVGGTVVWQRKE